MMQRRLFRAACCVVPLPRFQHSGAAAETGTNSESPAPATTDVSAPKLVSAVRQRNFSEAQTQAAALFQQKWREEYNLPAAFTLICLVVWYWIAWAHRSVQRKCAALEAAAEKDVRETVQVVQSISEQWRSDMLRASTEMKLIIAKNSELTGDIDRLTTALRGCQVKPNA